jgi:hypothetical protein
LLKNSTRRLIQARPHHEANHVARNRNIRNFVASHANAQAKKGTDTVTNSTRIAVALTLILGTVMIAAVGISYNFPADVAPLPFAVTPSANA